MKVNDLWAAKNLMNLMIVTGIVCESCLAQELLQQTAPETPRTLEAVRVEQQVKPAFIIQPLSQRLAARRGQLLKFEYEIQSNARPTQLQIAPVAMTQQETGVIMPDPAAARPDVLQLLSPSAVQLEVGQTHRIECQMRVPPGNSPFLSYGILVTELPLDEPGQNPDVSAPRVGVRFLTQYLLRADIEVVGARGDSLTAMEIESGSLVAQDGSAMLNVMVRNPTDTPLEYQMRTELVSRDSGKRFRSQLWVPVRASQLPPERYVTRILADTRLRMEGTLSEPVFAGEYDLKVDLLHQTQVMKSATFPVTIQSGDFPAQDAAIVRVGRDISVEPRHVELSIRKGGNRQQALTIENSSQQTVVATLKPVAYLGTLADMVVIRPDSIELKSGQKRKVLVMISGRPEDQEHSYAYAQIEVRPEIGEAIGTQDIPIALLTNSPSGPEVSPTELSWQADNSRAGFRVPIRNTGKQHLRLNGRLSLRDQFGRGVVLDDGFGRWVLPGKDDQLWFDFSETPPPGTYTVRVEVQQGDQQTPFAVEQIIELRNTLPEQVSQRPAPGTGIE